MSVLAALVAQFLHGALMLGVAPLAGGLGASFQAVLSGRAPPVPWQPWRELIRLSRKQVMAAESASALAAALLPLCFGAMAVAALLVPSFTLGMASAPWSDLLAIAGLVTLSRVGLILAALDPGTARPGLAAGRFAMLGCVTEPALFLVILTLGLLGGTTNLDLLIGLQLQGMLQPMAAVALVAASLVLLAFAFPDPAPLATEFAGVDLALISLTDALRLLVWLDLIGGLFLPLGLAGPDAGLLGWVVGLLAWGMRLVALVAALAGLRGMFGRLQLRHLTPLAQAAAALGAVAALLVLASTVAP